VILITLLRAHARSSVAASIVLRAKTQYYDPALSCDSYLHDIIYTDGFLALPHPSSIPLGLHSSAPEPLVENSLFLASSSSEPRIDVEEPGTMDDQILPSILFDPNLSPRFT
jgi:hypothetical protein